MLENAELTRPSVLLYSWHRHLDRGPKGSFRLVGRTLGGCFGLFPGLPRLPNGLGIWGLECGEPDNRRIINFVIGQVPSPPSYPGLSSLFAGREHVMCKPVREIKC